MTAFIAAAATLTLAVLAWLSVPVLRAVRQDFPHAAAVRRSLALFAVLTLAGATGIYAVVGRPQLLAGSARALPQASAPDLPQSMAALATHLERAPDDGLGWMTLARARFELGLYADAVRAYARAHTLLGDEPQLLAEYAEALALREEGGFTPQARALLARALYLQEDNRHALWLTGLAAYADGEQTGAVGNWRKALALAPPDSAEAQRLAQAIATAEARVGK